MAVFLRQASRIQADALYVAIAAVHKIKVWMECADKSAG